MRHGAGSRTEVLILSQKIGATGFEPATSWSQTKRSTKLSYAPERRNLNGEITLVQEASGKRADGKRKSLGERSSRRHPGLQRSEQIIHRHADNRGGAVTHGKRKNQSASVQQ